MKKWIVIAMIAALASASQAATSLKEGTREIAVSGNYDPDAADDYNAELEVSYGKFIADNLEVGIGGLYEGTEHINVYGVQGFVELNFDLGTEWVPYVGASVGWLGGEIEDPNGGDDVNNDTAAAAVAGGVKYFFTETVALSGEVEYSKASDDIFPNDDGDVEDDNIELNLALRFFIP